MVRLLDPARGRMEPTPPGTRSSVIVGSVAPRRRGCGGSACSTPVQAPCAYMHARGAPRSVGYRRISAARSGRLMEYRVGGRRSRTGGTGPVAGDPYGVGREVTAMMQQQREIGIVLDQQRLLRRLAALSDDQRDRDDRDRSGPVGGLDEPAGSIGGNRQQPADADDARRDHRIVDDQRSDQPEATMSGSGSGCERTG